MHTISEKYNSLSLNFSSILVSLGLYGNLQLNILKNGSRVMTAASDMKKIQKKSLLRKRELRRI
jgi:hypothetical protein